MGNSIQYDQVVSTLGIQINARVMYVYNPHPWYTNREKISGRTHMGLDGYPPRGRGHAKSHTLKVYFNRPISPKPTWVVPFSIFFLKLDIKGLHLSTKDDKLRAA